MEEKLNNFEKEIENFDKLEETMLSSVENFKNTFEKFFNYSQLMSRLYVYIHLKSDEDTANSKYQEYNSKINSMYAKFSAKTTFVEVKALELEKKIR